MFIELTRPGEEAVCVCGEWRGGDTCAIVHVGICVL